MRSSFNGESAAFSAEVEQLAAQYIRDGIAGPWNAIKLARETVMQRRRERAEDSARRPTAKETR